MALSFYQSTAFLGNRLSTNLQSPFSQTHSGANLPSVRCQAPAAAPAPAVAPSATTSTPSAVAAPSRGISARPSPSSAARAPRVKQSNRSASARRSNSKPPASPAFTPAFAPAFAPAVAPTFAPPPATRTLRSGAALADCLMSYSRMLHLMPAGGGGGGARGGSRDLVAAGAAVLAQVLDGLRDLADTNQVKGAEAESLLFQVERDLGRLQLQLAVAPEAFPVQFVRVQCAQAARTLRSV